MVNVDQLSQLLIAIPQSHRQTDRHRETERHVDTHTHTHTHCRLSVYINDKSLTQLNDR